ncbi:MAG: hypothetical protein WC654_02900 [Patescibacteria group bacterium]
MKQEEQRAPYIFLGVVMLIGSFVLFMTQRSLNDKIATAAESVLPAELTITVIQTPDCPLCFDVESAVSLLREQSVTLLRNDDVLQGSPQATDLIARYNISKLPTVVIEGEVDKEIILSFLEANTEPSGEARIWSAIPPPFVDAGDGLIAGLVDVTMITDTRCRVCKDPAAFVDFLVNSVGLVQNSTTTLDARDPAAKEILASHGIKTAPSVILSQDAEVYAQLIASWGQFGTVAPDGSFVAFLQDPPYIEVDSGKVRGLTTLTVLTDESCDACYDATTHKSILENTFGISLTSTATIDSASTAGKQLITKYKIEQLPTIILSGDGEAYPNLIAAWDTVGSVEDDGSFIFRNLALMGTYRNLSTGEIVTAQ